MLAVTRVRTIFSGNYGVTSIDYVILGVRKSFMSLVNILVIAVINDGEWLLHRNSNGKQTSISLRRNPNGHFINR